MINDTIRLEKNAFWISFFGTISLSVIGLIVFFISKSQIILLDSLFSLITAVDALISVWVVTVSAKNPSDDYPFGLIQARPMLALFNGVIILAFIFSAVFNSITVISSGGNAIPGKMIVIYAFLSVMVSLCVCAFLYFKNKRTHSPLIRLELIQWIQAMLISLSIGFVFGLSEWIRHPIMKHINAYLDSGMVILISFLFIPSIIKEIKHSGKQLLLTAPSDEIRQKITNYFSSVCENHQLQIKKVYMILSSGLLYVDIELFVIDQEWNWDKVNRIRNEAEISLSAFYPDVEIAISFYDMRALN